MQYALRVCALAVILSTGAHAAEPAPGSSVESLLQLVKARNPEYAAMRHEADAAHERVNAAGALPDPRLQIELRDITMGGEQSATLAPNRVGATKYQVTQELPWFGKRGLRRDIAALEAQGASGRATGTWLELSARIKASYAQSYYLHQNERLTREILELMNRLEQVAQARYAGNLAVQQDVIRAQVEQTNLKNELLALESERHHIHARLNVLTARPAGAELAEPMQLRELPARLDYAALEQRVRQRNPQLAAEDARARAAEKSLDLAYKNRYPDLMVGIAPMQSGNAVREWELMFELNIPLQQSSRRSQEREAQAMLAAAQARKDASINQALADLSENISALDVARRTEQSIANDLLPQAELTYKSALASYENGKVDFATLLDAQRQIRQARQNRIKVQAEGQMRLAEIERLLGEEL